MYLEPLSQRDMRLLAATLHLEAAGQPDEGILAVAQVILNRAANPRSLWQAGTALGAGPIERTVLARLPGSRHGQFSCWNGDCAALMRRFFVAGDPDRGWIAETTARRCRDLLRGFLDGRLTAPPGVEGASHYFNPDLAAPRWGRNWREGVAIGDHVFLTPDLLTPPEAAIEPVNLGHVPAWPGAEPSPMRKKARRHRGLLGLIAGALAAIGIDLPTDWLWQIDGLLYRLPHLTLPVIETRTLLITLALALIAAALLSVILKERKPADDSDPRYPPETRDPGRPDRRRDGGDARRPLPEPDPAGADPMHRPRGGRGGPFGGGAF